MHNICIWFGTWEERRMNHQPLQCIMRQTLSFKQALNMHALFVPKLKYGVPFKNLVLREWTGRRTLSGACAKLQTSRSIVRGFGWYYNGNGEQGTSKGNGKIKNGKKKREWKKKETPFCTCITRLLTTTWNFLMRSFIDDVNKGEQIFLFNFF